MPELAIAQHGFEVELFESMSVDERKRRGDMEHAGRAKELKDTFIL